MRVSGQQHASPLYPRGSSVPNEQETEFQRRSRRLGKETKPLPLPGF